MARAMLTASSVARARAIRVVLVSTSAACNSRMARLTPGAIPKSSALTMRRGTGIAYQFSARKTVCYVADGVLAARCGRIPLAGMMEKGPSTGSHPSGRLAQLVRAPALQAGSRGFESLAAHQIMRVRRTALWHLCEAPIGRSRTLWYGQAALDQVGNDLSPQNRGISSILSS